MTLKNSFRTILAVLTSSTLSPLTVRMSSPILTEREHFFSAAGAGAGLVAALILASSLSTILFSDSAVAVLLFVLSSLLLGLLLAPLNAMLAQLLLWRLDLNGLNSLASELSEDEAEMTGAVLACCCASAWSSLSLQP